MPYGGVLSRGHLREITITKKIISQTEARGILPFSSSLLAPRIIDYSFNEPASIDGVFSKKFAFRFPVEFSLM